MQYIVLNILYKLYKYFVNKRYSALSELYGKGWLLPPVAPEVIHIKPLLWLPVIARSSFGALSPSDCIRLEQPFTPLCLYAFMPSLRLFVFFTPHSLVLFLPFVTLIIFT